MEKKIWSVPSHAINRFSYDSNKFFMNIVFFAKKKRERNFSRRAGMYVAHLSRKGAGIIKFTRNPENTTRAKILFIAIYRKKRYGPDFLLYRVRTLAAPLFPQYMMPCACFSLRFHPMQDVRTRIPKGVINRAQTGFIRITTIKYDKIQKFPLISSIH